LARSANPATTPPRMRLWLRRIGIGPGVDWGYTGGGTVWLPPCWRVDVRFVRCHTDKAAATNRRAVSGRALRRPRSTLADPESHPLAPRTDGSARVLGVDFAILRIEARPSNAKPVGLTSP